MECPAGTSSGFRVTSQPSSNMETTPLASRAAYSVLWKWPALYQASLSPGSSSLPSSWQILWLWEARRLRGALVRSSNRTQSSKPPDGKILWQRPRGTDTLSNVTAHIICENHESLGLLTEIGMVKITADSTQPVPVGKADVPSGKCPGSEVRSRG